MLAFTLRRAVQAIGVMFAVGIIAFSMFRFAGDPVNQIVSIDTSAAEREAVRKSLELLGVKDNQMEAVSYGKERPAVQGSNEEAWAKNRRAELNVR